ncbi:SH2 domain-containing protein 5 [Elysia marginata]|uniref:SH2 domain-containing protein 5 n=1 Tax=Elysia marginata TaxID=1093978 RepID=A0AAV4FA52_9GAST|nr:SH2 domain-containing protein 5 [Elysia marginata]
MRDTMTARLTRPRSKLRVEIVLSTYIGTFSVSGSDKDVRERQMESQLEHMRNAQERRPVQLVISAAGVKVILPENNNVFMEHSLKRIWYATCDPEHQQFSFLAREPKTSAEVQYCHAFVTQTPEQAEELIALIGEAFKSTYTEQQQQQPQNGKDAKEAAQQPKKQPTFHELIEQQVLQQQAKFREIEQEAQSALQQTLNQIATPTPFSERAQSRMEERRRQSEDLTLANFSAAAARRDWAKHEIHRVKHSPDRSTNNNHSSNSSNSNSPASNPNRRSEIPTRQSTPKTSPFKRNSVPPQVSLSSSQPHPLSALAIKESLESKAGSKGSKFKGSPVTALKNEIDRRLSMSNGEEPPPPPPPSLVPVEPQQSKQQHQQHASSMANRPLPLPPDEIRSPQRSRHRSPQQQATPSLSGRDLPPTPLHANQRWQHHPMQHQRSLDDYHLPRSSTSPQVMASSRPPSGVAGAGNPAVRLRDSPRRRQPRPMSEIATSSSGHGGARPGGSSYYEQQRQSLLSNFTASFNLQPHAEGEQQAAGSLRADGMYIYGPGPAPAPREAEAYSLATARMEPTLVVGGAGGGSKRGSWAQEEAVSLSPSRQQFYQQQAQTHHNHNGKTIITGNGHREASPSSSSSSSSPALGSHQNPAASRQHGSPQHLSSSSPSHALSSTLQETAVLRYQNDSQFVSPSAAGKQGPG